MGSFLNLTFLFTIEFHPYHKDMKTKLCTLLWDGIEWHIYEVNKDLVVLYFPIS